MKLPDHHQTWASFWRKEVKPQLEKYPETRELNYMYLAPSGAKVRRTYMVVEVKAALFDELSNEINVAHNDAMRDYLHSDARYVIHLIRKVCHKFGLVKDAYLDY